MGYARIVNAFFLFMNGDSVGFATMLPSGSFGSCVFSALPYSMAELDAVMHTCNFRTSWKMVIMPFL
jgi:hypothetical protein